MDYLCSEGYTLAAQINNRICLRVPRSRRQILTILYDFIAVSIAISLLWPRILICIQSFLFNSRGMGRHSLRIHEPKSSPGYSLHHVELDNIPSWHCELLPILLLHALLPRWVRISMQSRLIRTHCRLFFAEVQVDSQCHRNFRQLCRRRYCFNWCDTYQEIWMACDVLDNGRHWYGTWTLCSFLY